MCKVKSLVKKGMSKLEAFMLSVFVTVSIIVQEKVNAAITFGDMADKFSDQMGSFATVIKYGSFIVGFYLVVTGFNDMRQAREKQTTVGACAIKVFIGFALCSVMFIIESGTATLGGNDVELKEIL